MHDLAFRTPILFHWPGTIAPRVFEHELVSSVDIVPTLLDYAGLTAPEALPGFSLRPVIEGTASAKRAHLIGHITQLRAEDDVMGRNAEGYYLRTPRWHFMWYITDETMALYDMQNDPEATQNVISEHPDLADQFMQAIETWKQEMLAQVE